MKFNKWTLAIGTAPPAAAVGTKKHISTTANHTTGLADLKHEPGLAAVRANVEQNI